MERLFREEGGLPLLDEAAHYLGLTEQTLRRRLKKEGYAFKQIKEDTSPRCGYALYKTNQF